MHEEGLPGLPVHEAVVEALYIYGAEPDAFDDAVTLAQTFVSYAAVALANAHLYDSTATLAQRAAGSPSDPPFKIKHPDLPRTERHVP